MKILLLTCPRDDGTSYSHVYSSLSEEAKGQIIYYLRQHFEEVSCNAALELLPSPDDKEETEFIDYDGKWICTIVWQDVNEE